MFNVFALLLDDALLLKKLKKGD